MVQLEFHILCSHDDIFSTSTPGDEQWLALLVQRNAKGLRIGNGALLGPVGHPIKQGGAAGQVGGGVVGGDGVAGGGVDEQHLDRGLALGL